MLRFRLFGIPVGVHLTFGFVALLGATVYRGWDIAWWTVAAFVSILLHEFGHALSARAFGASNISVTLYGLGGLTTYSYRRDLGHAKSFVISAAGSFVGIMIGGAAWLLVDNGTFIGVSRGVAVFIDSFIFTALWWGILNWIPIVPLDGGHMVKHFISIFNEERAPLISQIITWATVAVIVPIAWVEDYRFAALIVVMFAFMGLREYRDEMDRRRAAQRIEAQERGVVTPDEVRPAPPAPPTPPVSRGGSPGQPGQQPGAAPRNPPEFPI